MSADLQERFYRDHYAKLVEGGASGRYHDLTHRLLERPYGPQHHFPCVLEVGAGGGEHFPFVRHSFDRYCLSDLRMPVNSHEDSRVSFVPADVQDLPFDDDSFNRLVSTCLLHHVNEPVRALEGMRRVVRPGGAISIMIASDPGLAYRTAQRISSGRQHSKAGFSEWRVLHAMEHRNHAASLHQLITWVFKNDYLTDRGFPLRPASWWNVNLLSTYQVRLRS